MSFDSTDLETVEQAIRDLAAGKRVDSLTVGGKQLDFGKVGLNGLYTLRSHISESLAASDPQPSYILTRTSKGL